MKGGVNYQHVRMRKRRPSAIGVQRMMTHAVGAPRGQHSQHPMQCLLRLSNFGAANVDIAPERIP
jgi:hypothetical protein